jgi:(p)ppGpp synthase/HD superfamily hydrolase
MLTDRFADALAFAERLHRTQKRKGNEVPYVAHLLAVAATVLEWGGDEDTAIAALLHDAVEDQGGLRTAEMIRSWYGARVVELVLHCTDSVTDETEDKLPWLDRKTAYIERLRHADAAVALITAADKLHNLRAIVRDLEDHGPATLQRFNQPDQLVWYYQSVTEVLSPFADQVPYRQLLRTLDDLSHLLAAPSDGSMSVHQEPDA